MTSCKDVYAFLNQVSAKNVTAPLGSSDTALLAQLNLIQMLTADQVHDLQDRVQSLAADQAALDQERRQRADLAENVEEETRSTHSILFHLEGKDKQAAKLQQENQDAARLKAVDGDLLQRQQQFGQLVAQRSLLDTITPCGDGFVGLTGLGALETRNLAIRLYRVSDTDFQTYWNQSQKITDDLTNLATGGAAYLARIQPYIAGAEKSNLWAISIGLAKNQPDTAQGTATFLNIYNTVQRLSNNVENRLLASEILFSLPQPLGEVYPTFLEIQRDVGKLNIPNESSLGVASILLLGRRGDGTIATPNLAQYLNYTRSYESAALLAIVNLPVPELGAKFQSIRAMFAGWGYQTSEDTELSAAYLATSEVPVEGISTKLAILAKGLSAYLAYPLVAASVLATISTLEANDTLNLLEHAYDIVGRRAMPMSQAELICLAVRMLHGIRNELVGPLDATAAVAPTAAAVSGVYGPRFFFVPIVLVNYGHFSTYSGIGGAHPGHVHGFGGGGGGVGGG